MSLEFYPLSEREREREREREIQRGERKRERDIHREISEIKINKNKTEFLPLTDVKDVSSVDLDIYYKSLYQLLIDDTSIDFYGSVPQHVLFGHMKSSMILFYPNTYAETCCTTILEAMAYRCNVISSELGAIPETSNGFANLFNPSIAILHDKISTDEMVKNPIQLQSMPTNYQRKFVEKTVDILNNYNSNYNVFYCNSKIYKQ